MDKAIINLAIQSGKVDFKRFVETTFLTYGRLYFRHSILISIISRQSGTLV